MNSDERKAARRQRREAKRAAKKHHATLEEVADANSLYKAQAEATLGVGWKPSVQRYRENVLINIYKSRVDLLNGNDVRKGVNKFIIWERGKLRNITAVGFYERVIQKSLARNAILPSVSPSFIASNSANIKGRGPSYAIKMICKHLAKHYRTYGSDGYILQIDFKNYFGSIPHKQLKEQIDSYLTDPRIAELAKMLIDETGETVGLGLGSEPNQIWAVSFPGKIDHFVCEMLRPEAYGRYMDDSYLIDYDKEYLKFCLIQIKRLCKKLGIEVHEKKTKIIKLSRGFVFLKKRFSYSETGKIIMKPCKDSITRERRRIKKHHKLVLEERMTIEQAYQSYQSWRGGLVHINANRILLNMDSYFKRTFDDIERSEVNENHH